MCVELRELHSNGAIRVSNKGQKVRNRKRGIKNFHFTTKTSAKVKVALEKGNTIENLRYDVYQKKTTENGYSTETVYKKVSNGGKVILNKKPYMYKDFSSYTYGEGDGSVYESLSDAILAYTTVDVVYKDKYTKSSEVLSVLTFTKEVK